jgi:heme-degrading monooxygenase HmoA
MTGGKMIARMWRGYATREDADAYAAMLKPELLPGLSKVKGYCGSYLLRRDRGDEVEFMTIILWDSIDAIKAVAGERYERAVIPEERRKYLLRWDDVAAHYDVDHSHGVSSVS